MEKRSQALQGSGVLGGALHRSSCAAGTGESRVDGGFVLFPKLQETVFILTLGAEEGRGGRPRLSKAAQVSADAPNPAASCAPLRRRPTSHPLRE